MTILPNLTSRRSWWPGCGVRAPWWSARRRDAGRASCCGQAWSPLLPPLILAAGGLSAMVTQQWLKHVYSSRSIPAYTSPFVARSWVLLLFAEPSAPVAHVELNTLHAIKVILP